MKKLAIITTHPIQYQTPLWQQLGLEKIDFEVWFLTDFGQKESYDNQFGISFKWDIPQLDGYKNLYIKTAAHSAPNKGFFGIKLNENIQKRLIENRITHVLINGWQVYPYWQILGIAKKLGLTTILRGESNDLKPEIKWKSVFKKILLKQFFKKVDYFLYIGTANKRLYRKYGIAENKLLSGLYSIDNKRFAEQAITLTSKKNKIREQWGIPYDSICFLFSGKFIHKKRPIDIIQALNNVKLKHKIHLLMVGDGELYQDIKSNTNVVFDKKLGIVNKYNPELLNVSITGFLNQTEIPKAYSAADCLVLASDYGETWGLVVNEAMASNLPAIVSDQCGSSEDLIAPLDKKLIFRTGDIQGLEASIINHLKNPLERKKIQEHIQKFSYENVIGSIKFILNQ